jgi:hypothetical protein
MIGGPFIMAARNSACQSALCASHNFHHSEMIPTAEGRMAAAIVQTMAGLASRQFPTRIIWT